MMKSFTLALVAAATFAAAPVSAANVVNVNGLTNASTNGSNAVSVALAAGTYTLTFTQDLFSAFSRFSSNAGCSPLGAGCTQGWENSVRYLIGGTTFQFGDGNASGGIGPVSGGGYYSSAAQSLTAAGQYVTTFTLANPGNVSFFIYDDNLSDNRGGVSLAISAVPEPATWALMMLGFGAIGFAMRRNKVRTTVAYA